MELSGRQKRILRCLLENEDYLATAQIAEILNVSNKTIYRELQELRIKLQAESVNLDTKIGVGIRIHMSGSVRNKLYAEVSDGRKLFEIDERRYRILTQLLQTSPKTTSIAKLSDQFYVSRSSIQNDLHFIEEWLLPYQLYLIKSLQGTGIDGNELDIRRALTNVIIRYHNNDRQPISLEDSRMDQQTRHALYEQFNKEVVASTEMILTIAENKLGYQLSDPYYINIMTHLLILINRVKLGNPIVKEALIVGNMNVHIFRIAVEMVEDLQRQLALEIPDSEIFYIYQHLDSSGNSGTELIHNGKLQELYIEEHAKKYGIALMKAMDQKMNVPFMQDTYLKHYLLLHLHSMIGRMKYKIEICCPLLESIKEENTELFYLLSKVIKEITAAYYPTYHVTDDELAYLLLYFQAALEEREIAALRIIVVCSSGIGTSHLLMTRIKKTFPNWEIVDLCAASQLDSAPLEKIDLIISTIKIPNYNLQLPLAYVSVLFNEADIQNVKQVLKHTQREEKP